MKMSRVVLVVLPKTMFLKCIKNMGQLVTLFVGYYSVRHKCCNDYMGFQKLETISFDFMYVDKRSTQMTHVQVWGNKL